MDIKKLIKQTVSAGILLIMIGLTAGTAIRVMAEDDDSGGSYALTIIKELAPGSPAEAENKVYTFVVHSSDGPKTVTITGAGEKTISFSNATYASVEEITDHIDGLTDENGDVVDITSPEIESRTPVLGRKETFINDKEGGTLTVERPADAPTATWFKVTGTSFDKKEKYDLEPVKIEPGGKYKFTALHQGSYTVEELKAEEGFSVTANDHIAVDAGKTQTVVIHGSSAKMTIHAPGKEGDGHIHYFNIFKGDDLFKTISAESEKDYVLEHLSAGTYTVSEWEHPGTEDFSVTTPVTTKGAEKIYYYNNFGNYVTNSDYPASKYTYLGLRIGAADGLPVGTEYKTQIVGTWRDTGVSGARTWTRKGYNANGGTTDGRIYPLTWNGEQVYLNAGTFRWGVFPVDGMTRAKLRVTPYTEEATPMTTKYSKSGVPHSVTVDKRGWLTISKTGKDDTDHTVYAFKISGPDKYEETIWLKRGESETLEGLAEGNYTVTETIDADKYDAFTMDVEDSERITKESPSTELFGTIQGKGTITITKNGSQAEDRGRIYSIRVDRKDDSGDWQEYTTVTLKAGEDVKARALDPGDYRAVALDEYDPGFEITYYGNQVYAVNGKAVVTFKNSFSLDEGSYHVIHEYYWDNGNGKYEYEGSSEISTVHGLPVNAGTVYDSSAVAPLFVHGGYQYTYDNHAYGRVESSAAADTPATAPPEEPGTQDLPSGDVPPDGDASPYGEALPGGEAAPDGTTLPDGEAPSDGETPSDGKSLPEETPSQSGEESSQNPTGGADAFRAADDRNPSAPEPTGTPEASEGSETPEEPGTPDASENPERPEEPRTPDASGPSKESETPEDSAVSEPSGTEAPSGSSKASPSEPSGLPEPSEAEASSEMSPEPTGMPEESDDPETPEETGTPDAPAFIPAEQEFDSRTGFISRDTGYGPEPDKIQYNYSPDAGMTGVHATEDGSEIIILRYVRTEEPPKDGTYHIIHMYYLRDERGDTFEGSSELSEISVGPLNNDNHGFQYKVDGIYDKKGTPIGGGVALQESPVNFNVDGVNYTYTYESAAYGTENVSGSAADFFTEATGLTDKKGQGVYIHIDDAMECAYATEEGEHVIILRYYRKPSGFYNVVHEYYFREKIQGSESSERSEQETFETLKPQEGAGLPAVFSIERAADEDFEGTLTNMDDWMYTFEGRTETEQISAPLNQEFTKEDVEERLEHEDTAYQYLNVGYGQTSGDSKYESLMERASAVATEQGDHIIILRYYRETKAPDEPENPNTPPDDPEPEKPDTPPENPERPEKTEPPESSENPADSEDAAPQEITAPPTGDNSRTALWGIIAAFSGCGLAALILSGNKGRKYGKNDA